jgi:hypothetical protein
MTPDEVLNRCVRSPQPTEDTIEKVLDSLTTVECLELINTIGADSYLIGDSTTALDETWTHMIRQTAEHVLQMRVREILNDPDRVWQFCEDIDIEFKNLQEKPLSEREREDSAPACKEAGYSAQMAAEAILEDRRG